MGLLCVTSTKNMKSNISYCEEGMRGAALTEGYLREDALLILGVDGGRHVRRDEAGRHSIAGDVARRKLARHRLRQPDDASLAVCNASAT